MMGNPGILNRRNMLAKLKLEFWVGKAGMATTVLMSIGLNWIDDGDGPPRIVDAADWARAGVVARAAQIAAAAQTPMRMIHLLSPRGDRVIQSDGLRGRGE